MSFRSLHAPLPFLVLLYIKLCHLQDCIKHFCNIKKENNLYQSLNLEFNHEFTYLSYGKTLFASAVAFSFGINSVLPCFLFGICF